MLSCGGWEPSDVLRLGSIVVGAWDLCALSAYFGVGDIVRSAVDNDGMAGIRVEDDIRAFIGEPGQVII